MAVVEVASYGARISLDGNRLKIERSDVAPVFAVIEDLDLVVVEVPGVDVSGNALAALAAAGVSAMFCDRSHRPTGWLQPVGVHSAFTPERARRQARMPERSRARLWRSLVRGKIHAQAGILAKAGVPTAANRLHTLVQAVAEGDPSNVEATAARIYWPALFGDDFLRRGSDARASALDFGYAVLRAIVCRSVVAAGLHPDLGVSHRSPSNGFNLADDLIEPYRPAVDLLVHAFACENPTFDLRSAKSRLSEVGDMSVRLGIASLRCRAAIAATAASFARIVDGDGRSLALPEEITESAGNA